MTSISPDVGSVEGGQTVTVTGRGFLKSHTSVEIGGVPCEVQSVSPTEVVCVTGPKPEDAKYYPGLLSVFISVIIAFELPFTILYMQITPNRSGSRLCRPISETGWG